MARPEISASIPTCSQLFGEELAGVGDVVLALVALLGDELLDLGVLARVQGGEGEVLELPLDRVDPQPVGQRRVDLQRLARLRRLFLLRQGAERAHVVEAVGQLDQDHPDVGGHRHHHLAVVLGLPLVAALEGDPGQLGDAVDQLGDLLAELGPDLLQAGAGVLDRVVEQGGAEGLGVEPHAGADLGHADRVGDELVARAAQLVGVAVAGEVEGAGRGRRGRSPPARRRRRRCSRPSPSASALSPGGRIELLDHGEEIGEELLVALRLSLSFEVLAGLLIAGAVGAKCRRALEIRSL